MSFRDSSPIAWVARRLRALLVKFPKRDFRLRLDPAHLRAQRLFMNRFPALLISTVVLLAISLPAQAAVTVAKPHEVVAHPPLVQMLVPGFTVRELPVALRNLNNLVYAPDGRLFALGYDGNVYQLKDTNGDGLEDTATDFYKNERNEIPPSIGMAWGPGGLYIASRGRIVHLRDK